MLSRRRDGPRIQLGPILMQMELGAGQNVCESFLNKSSINSNMKTIDIYNDSTNT